MKKKPTPSDTLEQPNPQRLATDGRYGTATVGLHTTTQRELPIQDFVRCNFTDGRLCSVAMVAENGIQSYIMSVENYEISGQQMGQTIHLGRESLIAMLTTTMLYMEIKDMEMDELMEDAVDSGHIKYECSDNLDGEMIKSL
ncbi:MAG: hypothetical protein EXR21_10300 [Flavobacteriaceae bacterium]|nr:hypothetical protein [Flavobacteriaceae bacterium]